MMHRLVMLGFKKNKKRKAGLVVTPEARGLVTRPAPAMFFFPSFLFSIFTIFGAREELRPQREQDGAPSTFARIRTKPVCSFCRRSRRCCRSIASLAFSAAVARRTVPYCLSIVGQTARSSQSLVESRERQGDGVRTNCGRRCGTCQIGGHARGLHQD